MSFLSETLRAFSFADLCTGLAGADLVAPPPEDTVVLDLRPRIGTGGFDVRPSFQETVIFGCAQEPELLFRDLQSRGTVLSRC